MPSRVLIAGGGIAGLVTALTLHQIGVPCRVLESDAPLKHAGVGMNLQPNAVRELYDLGIGGAALNAVGLPLREWALVGRNGKDIWAEPRGVKAGYNWPQFSVDRGLFHRLLHRTLLKRLGPDCLIPGARVVEYRQNRRGVTVVLADGREIRGRLLIGADGLFSQVRAQMHPDEPPLNWVNAVLWRGVTRAKPLRTGSSFIGMGTDRTRVVTFPISHPGPDGLSLIYWAGVVALADHPARHSRQWFRPVAVDEFIHHFDEWKDACWIDVPALFRHAEVAFENPLLDRDPVPTWRDGRVLLIGDAAHPMLPSGATAATQAIIDARVLGACMVEHGVNEWALDALDDRLCAPISTLVYRNRSEGPFELLSVVQKRCGGIFDNIDDVVEPWERQEYMHRYQRAAGFATEMLNSAPPIIPAGARARVA